RRILTARYIVNSRRAVVPCSMSLAADLHFLSISACADHFRASTRAELGARTHVVVCNQLPAPVDDPGRRTTELLGGARDVVLLACVGIDRASRDWNSRLDANVADVPFVRVGAGPELQP